MNFNYLEYLPEELFAQLNELKAFHPEVIEQQAQLREKPGFPHKQLVFAAADHNARMITEYKSNPIGLSNRREYLTRLIRMLQSDKVDGVEATPDIIEDLILVNYLFRERGWKDFLRGKMLVGTVNRGGLKDTVWEMDDLRSCFTVDRIVGLRMDGVKFMIRLNPADARARKTLEYCAATINEAAAHGLPVFVEGLYVDTVDGRFVMRTDSVSLCKVVGVVGALGCTAANKWIEVPLNQEYTVPVSATTCPVLVVPDERAEKPLDVIKEYTEQIGISYQVRGILLGRNVMYNESDPLVLAEGIADVWHSGCSPEEAYERAQKAARL